VLFAIHASTSQVRYRLGSPITMHMRPSSATPRGFGAKIVISGPLFSDDGEKMIGSLFLVEAPDRDEVEAFNRADPFTEAGIWGTRFDYGICTAPRLKSPRSCRSYCNC